MRTNPKYTRMRHVIDTNNRYTPYRRHVMSTQCDGQDDTVRYANVDGSYIANLTVSLRTGHLDGRITIEYLDTVLLDLPTYVVVGLCSIRESGKSTVLNLMRLICGNHLLPLCPDIKLRLVSVGACEVSAELIKCGKTDSYTAAQTAHELWINRYEMNPFQSMGTFVARFPMAGIYVFPGPDEAFIDAKFCDMCLVSSKSGVYDGQIIDSSVNMQLHQTGMLSEKDPFSVYDFSAFIQAGPVSFQCNKMPGTTIVRYVSTLMVEASHSYVDDGYLSYTGKCAEYHNSIASYKEGIFGSRYDVPDETVVENTYTEGRWFSATPRGQFYGIPKPTSTPVDTNFIDTLTKLAQSEHCEVEQCFCCNEVCPFTGQNIQDNLPVGITCAQYTFALDGINYKFSGELFYYMSRLNVHPTEKFKTAVLGATAAL